MQNSLNSLYSEIFKKASKAFVISRMHVTLKPQDYNCPTVTTLIYLGHLLKVREMTSSRCQWNQMLILNSKEI